MDVTYKRGDTAPPLQATLATQEGLPVDLTGADVKLILNKVGDPQSVYLELTATPVGDPALGVVERDWQEGDLALTGYYLIEWEVTYSGGKVETFPGEAHQMLRVLRDLNPVAP